MDETAAAHSGSRAQADAVAIWQAGLDAVRSDRLVMMAVGADAHQLSLCDVVLAKSAIGRIEVVGAGKAGAGMALGLERAIGSVWLADKQVRGFLNVPANCLDREDEAPQAPTTATESGSTESYDAGFPSPPFGATATTSSGRIVLHAARPASRNEPTAAGVAGTREILRRVASLNPADLCICLISGGGSALLPAPPAPLRLDDLLHVTQHLSAAGASIEQLNAVRRCLSEIAGGRLAAACRAATLVTFVISDVMGDPLELIASGPTVPDVDPLRAVETARQVCDTFHLDRLPGGPRVRAVLDQRLQQAQQMSHAANSPDMRVSPCVYHNRVIGNNQVAVEAAAREAERRGYTVEIMGPQPSSQTAEEAGRALLERLRAHTVAPPATDAPVCVLSGGEPVVRLAPAHQRGRGGRNQQLVLAALCELFANPLSGRPFALLSGGTDGEDGPTDAAGAVIDHTISARVAAQGLDAADYLRRNDAYALFQQTDGLLITGPTDTNVCDLRVAVLGRPRAVS